MRNKYLAAAAFAATFYLIAAEQAVAQEATLKLGGRVMMDYTIGSYDNPDSDIDATELRRARLFVSGKYGDQIKYKFEVNKASGKSIAVTDAYIQFLPKASPFKIKVGQFKTHNSLDEQNSSRFMSALERSAFTDAFGFDRRLGISVGTSGSNYTFDAGAFTTNLEESGGSEEGRAYSARATFNPIKTADTTAHIGASWRYRSKGNTTSDLRYRQRPYTHVVSSRIIDTGRFAESDNFLGAEAAIIHKNFWAAGELAQLGANGSGVNADADFGGFYLEAGLFLGGRRTYKGGKFGRPKVDNPYGGGGMGALSFVARYDSLDLEDAAYLGELETIVVGADWWPTKQTRLGINYFNSDAENGSADKASGLAARVQFDF